jgi:hypothetical protein
MGEPATAFPKDMTLRDWFAAQAMRQLNIAIADNRSIAARAYEIADAMLAARDARANK